MNANQPIMFNGQSCRCPWIPVLCDCGPWPWVFRWQHSLAVKDACGGPIWAGPDQSAGDGRQWAQRGRHHQHQLQRRLCESKALASSWHIDNLFVKPSEMAFGPTKFGKLRYVVNTHCHFGPIYRMNLVCNIGYTHIQCLTLVLSNILFEHRTSFQVYCQTLPLSVLSFCSCDNAYHKQEVSFILCNVGRIVT